MQRNITTRNRRNSRMLKQTRDSLLKSPASISIYRVPAATVRARARARAAAWASARRGAGGSTTSRHPPRWSLLLPPPQQQPSRRLPVASAPASTTAMTAGRGGGPSGRGADAAANFNRLPCAQDGFHFNSHITIQYTVLYKRLIILLFVSPLLPSRRSKVHHSSQRLDSLHRNGHRYRSSEPLSSPSFSKGIYLRAEWCQHCCGQGGGRIANEVRTSKPEVSAAQARRRVDRAEDNVAASVDHAVSA